MKRILSALALLALAACQQPAAPSDGAQAAGVEAAEAALAEAVAAENLDAVMSAYAADAVLYTPDSAPSATPDAIRANFEGVFADPGGRFVFTPRDATMASSGDMAFTTGTFVIDYTDAESQSVRRADGEYVTIWRRQDDGAWKIVRDISSFTGKPVAAPTDPASAAP